MTSTATDTPTPAPTQVAPTSGPAIEHLPSDMAQANIAEGLVDVVGEPIDPGSLTSAEVAQVIPRLHEQVGHAGDVSPTLGEMRGDASRIHDRRCPTPANWSPLTA